MELADIPRLVNEISGRGQDDAKPRYPAMLGELSVEQLRQFGEKYLEDTRVYRTGKPYFIDKMPNNFRHIGLIHLILPNARIIDARREAMDCCFSNFKQLFASGQEFTYSIEDIARYYRSYVELMEHWDKVLPGKVLRVQHEDVVDDLEGNVRRMLEFVGLEFEPALPRVLQDRAQHPHRKLRTGAPADHARGPGQVAQFRALARPAQGDARIMTTAAPAHVQDTAGIESSSVTAWYVLILMSLVYTLSITDRYMITQVLEPIRLELKLTDAGVGLLTGPSLAFFYVILGFPISWLIDRSNRRNIIAVSIIAWSAMTVCTGPVAQFLAAADLAHRHRRWRSGRYTGRKLDHLRLFRRGAPSHGAVRVFARGADRCVFRIGHHRMDCGHAWLAFAVSLARRARRHCRCPHLFHGPGAAPRAAGRGAGGRQALVHGCHALSVDPAVRRASDDRQRAHRAVGLGPDVLDAHFSHAHLRTYCG